VRRPRGRASRIAFALTAGALVVLVLSQLLLPWVAERVIAGRVGRYGHVRDVSVTAWPALELLRGHADSVTVYASALALTPAQSADLLSQARHTDRVDAEAASVREGDLLLRRVTLRKRGALLGAQALADAPSIAAALPAGVRVELVSSAGGEVTVRVAGGLFGLGGSIEARARASGGRLIAEPLPARPGGGLHLVLFSDPRIEVRSVGAERISTVPLVYRLSMTARLR
jgi:hypothetical protein